MNTQAQLAYMQELHGTAPAPVQLLPYLLTGILHLTWHNLMLPSLLQRFKEPCGGPSAVRQLVMMACLQTRSKGCVLQVAICFAHQEVGKQLKPACGQVWIVCWTRLALRCPAGAHKDARAL